VWVGTGCKAKNVGNEDYLAKFCNAAARSIPRSSRSPWDFEQALKPEIGAYPRGRHRWWVRREYRYNPAANHKIHKPRP